MRRAPPVRHLLLEQVRRASEHGPRYRHFFHPYFQHHFPLNLMVKFLQVRSAAIFAVAIATLLSGCALLTAEPVDVAPAPSGLQLIYPAGSITTVQRADEALRDAAASRVAIEQKYRNEQSVCFKKFFVSDCTGAAKERHRIARAETRAVEVEADFVKRRDRAEQRDKSIAERAAQEAANAPQRLKETEGREKTAVDKAAQRTEGQAKSAQVQQKEAAVDPQARQRAFDAKTAQQQAKEASEQPRRSANAAAFEKKKADALARQKQIAENKAKKAAEQAAKEAAEKKPAADLPAAPLPAK